MQIIKNVLYVLVGAALFFLSFHVGESTLIGGFMHLTGCAFVCLGVHKKWCSDICDNERD